MPPADTAPPAVVTGPVAEAAPPATVHGWGGGPAATVALLRPRTVAEVRAAVVGLAGPRRAAGALPRGMGRSYGDAAQLTRGLVLETTRLKQLELDSARGVLTAQAGVTIGEMLARLVPAGWMVPVVPGTQHVTVGGAIAADIHGKNHGAAGSFGRHVEAIGLLTASGEVRELEPDDDLFRATVGGMGLTGVILWARIALHRVAGAWLSVDSDRVQGLDGALAALSAPGGPYRVAWLDLLGPRPGRGIVTRADHLDRGEHAAAAATVGARATVPARWPAGILRPSTVGIFNELRFRRAPRHERGRPEPLGAHMFPLDALTAWPRLYGRGGFVQYQLAVPPRREGVLAAVIALLRRRRVPCFLAILKDFGPASGAPLSFPIAGWTLALDLPRAAAGLEPALRRCDELVEEAGGRVYLTKDSRLRPDAVRAMYPELARWQEVQRRADPDGLWRSDLALRTGLVAEERR